MRRLVKALALASVLGLGACVAPTYNVRLQAVESQADTYRFRIFPYAFAVGGIMADRALDDEIVMFRVANGYASSRDPGADHLDSAYVYTVRFAR